MKKIIQAGFLLTDGFVIGTGTFHNVDEIPEGSEVAEEGFIDEDGEFFSRKQASEALSLDHLLDSKELKKGEQSDAFDQIRNQYGNSAATHLSRNLYQLLDSDHKKALDHLTGSEKAEAASLWHEHRLKALNLYLSSPDNSTRFIQSQGLWDHYSNSPTQEGSNLDKKLKQAHRIISIGSKAADESWLKPRNSKSLFKSEIDDLMKWEPSPDDIHRVAIMLHGFHSNNPEFKAAKFIANNYDPTEQELHDAWIGHEGNLEAFSLAAHQLPVTDDNIKLLRKIMAMSELSKSDMEVAAIPRNVKPYSKEDKHLAKLASFAFKENKVHSVQLNGKHSKGSALFRDEESGELYLLKPGSGALSSARGIKEEPATHSRREVGFNKIAQEMGLSMYVPDAALLLIDGEEVACLEFFAGTYKPVEDIKKEKNTTLEHIFGKFVGNGLIYKWAAMDYILGQTDRHAGNLMMDEGFRVRFIDAGSSFAGPSFNPDLDPKSWVPFYLRVLSPRKWSTLTQKEKFNFLPKLSADADRHLKGWIDSLDIDRIVELLNIYQLKAEFVVDRIEKLKDYFGTKSEFLRKFYSNNLNDGVQL